MAEPAWPRLLATARASSFVHVVLRVGGDEVEFVRLRQSTPPSLDEPAAQSQPAPAAVPIAVHAPAPGVVTLEAAEVGRQVGGGETLGSVRMHDSTLPVTSPASGRVERVHVVDGAFVEYGAELLTILPAEAWSRPVVDGPVTSERADTR